MEGNSKKVMDIVGKLLKNEKPLEIVERYLRPAMDRIGDLYNRGEIFLPHLILASQTVKPAFEKLEEMMGSEETRSRKKVLIATVKGDVHDIGKNIVAAVMRSTGYDVLDMGKDVPSDEIVRIASEVKPMVVALSAMMTTTAPRISEVVSLLREIGLNIPVLAGGASLNEKLAKELGADYYAKDAFQSVRILKMLEGGR